VSLYFKAWIFTLWAALVLMVIWLWPAWMDPAWHVPFIIIWLAHGVFALVMVVCPRCGLSLYRSNKGFIATNQPWPRRRCGGCGRDHAHNTENEPEELGGSE